MLLSLTAFIDVNVEIASEEELELLLEEEVLVVWLPEELLDELELDVLLVLDDEVDELLVDVLLDEEVVDELLLEDDDDCVVSVDEGKNQSIIEFKSHEHKSVGKDRTNNNFENLAIH